MDVTDDLVRAASAGERLYFLVDAHWTPAGNLVAAQAVGRYLLEQPRVREEDPPVSGGSPSNATAGGAADGAGGRTEKGGRSR